MYWKSADIHGKFTYAVTLKPSFCRKPGGNKWHQALTPWHLHGEIFPLFSLQGYILWQYFDSSMASLDFKPHENYFPLRAKQQISQLCREPLEPCLPLKAYYLLECLHKLVHRNGATQQRLQRLALWHIITHSFSLLAGGGLRWFGRELMDKKVHSNAVYHISLLSFRWSNRYMREKRNTDIVFSDQRETQQCWRGNETLAMAYTAALQAQHLQK